MADVTRTIGATTGASSTIAAAITWGQDSANYDRSTNDILILQLVDAQEFNESNLTVGGFTGTATSSKYARLETESAARHDGTYNTSKARVRGNTNGQHVLLISEDFVHFRHLAIQQDSTGDSDECIRVSAANTNDVLIEKSVLDLNNTTGYQDCIYSQETIGPISVFDCAFKLNAGNRAAINAQLWTGTNRTQTWHIEHVTVDCDGAGTTGPEAGISSFPFDSTNTVNHNIWNTVVFDAGPGDDYSVHNNANGTTNWNGQGNMGSDTSCTGKLGATNNLDSQTLSVTDEAATEFLVTSLTAGSENYQLLDGASSTDNAIGAAIDGGTRDSRIDLTTDIAGNPRPATYTDRDLGAFQTIADDEIDLSADIDAPASSVAADVDAIIDLDAATAAGGSAIAASVDPSIDIDVSLAAPTSAIAAAIDNIIGASAALLAGASDVAASVDSSIDVEASLASSHEISADVESSVDLEASIASPAPVVAVTLDDSLSVSAELLAGGSEIDATADPVVDLEAALVVSYTASASVESSIDLEAAATAPASDLAASIESGNNVAIAATAPASDIAADVGSSIDVTVSSVAPGAEVSAAITVDISLEIAIDSAAGTIAATIVEGSDISVAIEAPAGVVDASVENIIELEAAIDAASATIASAIASGIDLSAALDAPAAEVATVIEVPIELSIVLSAGATEVSATIVEGTIRQLRAAGISLEPLIGANISEDPDGNVTIKLI